MPLQPLGLDLDALKNIESPNLNFSTAPSDILVDIPVQANILTNGWIGLGIMMGLFVILYFQFSDKSQFAKFQYSDLRSTSIALGICSLMGLTYLQVNYFYDFKSVALFVILFTISAIILFSTERSG